MLKPCPDAGGRLVVNLNRDGKRRQFKVHRLVLLAFVGPCPHGHEVAHRDGDQANNRRSNLRYATPVENNGDKLSHGTQPRGAGTYNARLTEEQALWVLENRGRLSYSAMASRLGVHLQTIAGICQRKTWKHLEVRP